ncbi:MAG TPA: protein translocase subunit SecD, partial [Phycisphaerae bacterium]|nr:protein translocase subunit SecD [Phycisphaerae bacterium]
MWEKNLTQRLVLIGVVLVLAAWLLYPPKDRLRPGLDIAGGVELVFEIQEEEGERYPNLAEDMKRLLQKRVDPDGVFDLRWQVHGRNRLGVTMPLPPKDAAKLRDDYVNAREALFAGANIRRSALEQALRETPENRAQKLMELADGSAERERLLQEAARRRDEYVAALKAQQAGPPATQPATVPTTEPTAAPTTGPTSAPASAPTASAPTTEPAEVVTQEELDLRVLDAEDLWRDAVEAVLETNIDPNRFQETLELDQKSPIRDTALKDLRKQYPQLEGQISTVVEMFDAWRGKRGFLDGPADLRRLLKGAGVLQFRILAEPSAENTTKYDQYRDELHEHGQRPPRPGDAEGWFLIDNPLAFFNLDSQAQLKERAKDPKTSFSAMVADTYRGQWYVLAKLDQQDGLLASNPRRWQLKRAYSDRDGRGRLCVDFTLDVVGGDIFQELTRNNIDKPLCILVDDVAYSAPNIKSRIGQQGTITGDFSREKVNYLVQTMQAGALPARLKDTPISERTIGSSLGETNLHKAFVAGVAGVIVVALLMITYYLVSGAIANVALLMNIVLVLAAMAMLGARFTLAGIAGVILTIGMTVDANVLIFERMREEKARGSSLRMVIKNGYDKALSTIIDANVTTLLICVIIYYVGSEEIKGFGLTLGWGIVMSLFTALFVTRTVFSLLVKYHLISDIKMLQLIGVPKINWYAKRKFFIPLSLIVVVSGMSLLLTRSRKDVLDVEFLGGVNAEVELTQAGMTDVDLTEQLKLVGQAISASGERLGQATVEPVVTEPGLFRVMVPEVSAGRLAALLTEPLEDAGLLQRGGIDAHGGSNEITV